MKVKRIVVLTSLLDQYSAQLYSRSIPQVRTARMLRLFLCDDAVQIKHYIKTLYNVEIFYQKRTDPCYNSTLQSEYLIYMK